LKVIEPASQGEVVKFAGGWIGELIPEAVIIPLYTKIPLGYLETLQWLIRLTELVSLIPQSEDLEWDQHLTTSNLFKSNARSGQISIPTEKLSLILTEGHPRFAWRAILNRGPRTLVELLIDTTAMTQSFPVYQLWWHDAATKSMVQYLLQLNQIQAAINQLMTPRFAEFLRGTL